MQSILVLKTVEMFGNIQMLWGLVFLKLLPTKRNESWAICEYLLIKLLNLVTIVCKTKCTQNTLYLDVACICFKRHYLLGGIPSCTTEGVPILNPVYPELNFWYFSKDL